MMFYLMRNAFFVFISVFTSFFISDLAKAAAWSVPAPAGNDEFCAQGIGTISKGETCWWNPSGESTGVGLFNAPTKITTSQVGLLNGFSTSYVPYTGKYLVRLHACASSTGDPCTVTNSTQSFDSLKQIELTSDTPFVDQNPYFGGGSGTLNAPSSLCFTIVSEDGTEWSTNALRTCQDAPHLPEEPAFCYLNLGQDLNVDMGTMERGMISTVPGSTTKKTVPFKVVCSRDASLTATFTLKYTPITIIGSEVVATDKAGLGVAVYLDDKLMSTNEAVTHDFQSGVSNISLGFEVVRDPYVNIGTIGTGDFSADAVLVMTKN